MRLRWLLLVVLFFAATGPARAGDDAALWAAVRDGSAFAIMRHELAPGTGDPQGFDVKDCATQRNLSDAGRRQAVATGERFRANRITQAAVFSSAWCRCRETAELLGIGHVEHLAPLNSFFADFDKRAPQTEALKAWLAEDQGDKPLVLVTHQVNINALVGVYTTSGEIVVVRRSADGNLKVLGKL